MRESTKPGHSARGSALHLDWHSIQPPLWSLDRGEPPEQTSRHGVATPDQIPPSVWRFAVPDRADTKDHVYKILELVGSSEKSIEDAIQNAITRASKTIRGMKWFEVV